MKRIYIFVISFCCILLALTIISVNKIHLIKDTTNKEIIIAKEKIEHSVKETALKAKEQIKKQEQLVAQTTINYKIYTVPITDGFKSYMDYSTLTNKNSLQYQLQDTYAYTNDIGIRMVDNRYCVALGTYFNANIGQYIDLVLENGVVIPCILGDIKANIHTDSNNIITQHNGCMSEFIVDSQALPANIKTTGDISYTNNDWKTPVIKVIVYDKNILN